ncbi:uncharacterized protein BDR25DRAFT_347323 [Lindgomyces ingoldianus]|uniref:Uncharacterized protein n=1 Tax=Lindgomyces ingoldianus TaxID=673940 RepID=A0ACB6Q8B3_9PLEO|nr:uncharacterized protein BDR25DRAFT_347323 [Lindgomyces ingoldianus]KAF2463259.1 hypothetical protein BDR25DRAFT_347323 [Lindgomyces ingoldianus]
MSLSTSKKQVREHGDTNEDDWSHISDRQERKRIQNRLAQRNYRRNMKERIEALERAAAEHARSSSASVNGEPRTESPTHPYRDADLDTSLWDPLTMPLPMQLHAKQQAGNVAPMRRMVNAGHDQLVNGVRRNGDAHFDSLMDDSQMMQSLPSEGAFAHQSWPDVPDAVLFPSSGFENSDKYGGSAIHTVHGSNLHSGDGLRVRTSHSPPSEPQLPYGTQNPPSNHSSPAVAAMDLGTLCLQDISMLGTESTSVHSLRRPAALHRKYTGASSSSREELRARSKTPLYPSNNTLSKRKRPTSNMGSDVDYDVEESNSTSLSGSESEDIIPRIWNLYPNGTESSSSSSLISSVTGTSRNTDAKKKSVVSRPPSATGTLSTRLASAQSTIKPLGFSSIEDLCTQFWTADLNDRPSLADTQRLSRRRELPHMLSQVRERSTGWSDWEVQGWRDEVTRSAETVLEDECKRYLRREGKSWAHNSEPLPAEDVLRLKSTFQEEFLIVIQELWVKVRHLGCASRVKGLSYVHIYIHICK